MKCIVKTDIRVLKGGWKIADETDDIEFVKNLEVYLQIQGSKNNGYHLVMTPKGFNTADYHYQTIDEAISEAQEIWGVDVNEWN